MFTPLTWIYRSNCLIVCTSNEFIKKFNVYLFLIELCPFCLTSILALNYIRLLKWEYRLHCKCVCGRFRNLNPNGGNPFIYSPFGNQAVLSSTYHPPTLSLSQQLGTTGTSNQIDTFKSSLHNPTDNSNNHTNDSVIMINPWCVINYFRNSTESSSICLFHRLRIGRKWQLYEFIWWEIINFYVSLIIFVCDRINVPRRPSKRVYLCSQLNVAAAFTGTFMKHQSGVE